MQVNRRSRPETIHPLHIPVRRYICPLNSVPIRPHSLPAGYTATTSTRPATSTASTYLPTVLSYVFFFYYITIPHIILSIIVCFNPSQDLPTPFCKEARLTYVHMHERVPRTFYFVVSSPGGVAEVIFHVNFTLRHKLMSNAVDDDEEELTEPEEIHFPDFGRSAATTTQSQFEFIIYSTLMAILPTSWQLFILL